MNLSPRILTCILATSLCGAQFARGDDLSSLRLVPFPRQVQVDQGEFRLEALALTADESLMPLIKQLVGEELQRAGVTTLLTPRADNGTVNDNHVLLFSAFSSKSVPAWATLPPQAHGEEYALRIEPFGAAIKGADRAGVLHGVATLVQLIRANRRGNALPCLTIHDWPSLEYRAFQDDLTRGPSSTLEELEHEIRLGAALKMNVFTYYMEHQYAFSKHPVIGPKDGSLQPEELKKLVAYAAPRGVDILGNQQSFGHFNHILKHEEFAPLREASYILSPVNEASYQLLDDLYSEVIPLLPFRFFNVCCDETWDLGKGPSKELAAKIGVGGVYAGHIRRLHDLITGKYGKRMMMWGDIILHHPDKLDMIPKDTVMLTWEYEPTANYDSHILAFVKGGYEFWVCPGVSDWNLILPDFKKANANIQVFTRDGVRHGAVGMLNTAWDDDGETLNAPNWYGFAWGAECAWNGGTTSIEAFNRRIGTVLFGESGDHFGRAIELLGKTHSLLGMDGMFSRRFWKLDLNCESPTFPNASQIQPLLDITQPAIVELEACRKDATSNADLLDAVLFGARRMDLIGRRVLAHNKAAKAYLLATMASKDQTNEMLDMAISSIQEIRTAHQKLADEYPKLWLRENRPYALDGPMKRYATAIKTYDGILSRLASAREALTAHRPLPSLETIGLGLPSPAASRPASP